MAKLWDDMLKRMFTANPQHFLNWLTPGATLLHELSTELKTLTLTELQARQPQQTRDLSTDILYAILWYEVKTILHIEFQRRGDKEMGKRLWAYNTTTTITKGCPVHSVVIYLRKDRKIEESPYIETLPDGRPNHIFFYEAIKLWELSADLFFKPDREGLLPLATLTRDGKRREVVDEMIKRMVATHNTNLLSMALNFAGLVFDKPGEQEWLLERFEMYKKDLEDSWVYQKILREGREQGIEQGLEQGLEQGHEQGRVEGREEGRAEGLRETIIKLIENRYPTLVDLATGQVGLVKDANILQQTVIKLFGLQTAGEIEECLLALHDDAAKN